MSGVYNPSRLRLAFKPGLNLGQIRFEPGSDLNMRFVPDRYYQPYHLQTKVLLNLARVRRCSASDGALSIGMSPTWLL